MKKILVLLLMMITATFSSCVKEDLDDIRSRLSNLEQWQKGVNTSISSLRSIVMALESNDFVTSVTPLLDGTGYVINFVNSGAVTIRNGEKGIPVIGTRQHTDNKYYWTVDGQWLMNGTEKVMVTADAPQVRINSTDGKWEVSTNGGATWTSTNVKAQGDAIFASNGIDNTNADYVILTLADNATKIKLPRYRVFSIGADGSNDVIEITTTNSNIIPLSLPLGLKKNDLTAIMAQVISDKGTATDIKIAKAASTPWSVVVQKPTFEADGTCNNDATVTIKAPAGIAEGETAILEVTLVGNDGSKLVSTRALVAGMIWNGSIAASFASGTGTLADPFIISNGSELAYLAKQVNNGTDFGGKYFKQSNSFSLNNLEWTPIGKDDTKPFKGNFDGNGKAIADMKITAITNTYSSTDTKYAGLFGYVDGGSVKNITIMGSIIPTDQIEAGQVHIGGIIGYLKSGSVANLSASVVITARQEGMHPKADDNTYIGGAIGKSDVAFNGSVFNVTPVISFNRGDNLANRYIGHNVGWCIDAATTQSANSGYNGSDAAISISGNNGQLFINGVIK